MPILLDAIVIGGAVFFAWVGNRLPAPLLGIVAAVGVAVLFGIHEKEEDKLIVVKIIESCPVES